MSGVWNVSSSRPGLGRARRFAPAIGAVVVLAGLAMPFAGTGTFVRNGFGLSAALRSSGLLAAGPVRLAAVGVDVVPALAAIVLVLSGLATRSSTAARVAPAAGAAVGLLGLAAGIAVLSGPAVSWAVGAVVSAAAGAATLAAALLAALPLPPNALGPEPAGARTKGALRHG